MMDPLYVDCSYGHAAPTEEPLDLSLFGPMGMGHRMLQTEQYDLNPLPVGWPDVDNSQLLLQTAPIPAIPFYASPSVSHPQELSIPQASTSDFSPDAYPVCSTPSPSSYNQFLPPDHQVAMQPDQGYSYEFGMPTPTISPPPVPAPMTPGQPSTTGTIHWFPSSSQLSPTMVQQGLSAYQQQFLFDSFLVDPYPNPALKLNLARIVQARYETVQAWFQAQRNKFRARLRSFPDDPAIPESLAQALRTRMRPAKKRGQDATTLDDTQPATQMPKLRDALMN